MTNDKDRELIERLAKEVAKEMYVGEDVTYLRYSLDIFADRFLARYLEERGKEAAQEPVGYFTVSQGKSINQIIVYNTGLPDGRYSLYTNAAPQLERVKAYKSYVEIQSKLTERDEEIRTIRANLAQLEKDFDRRNEELIGAFAALAIEQGMRIDAEKRAEAQEKEIDRLKSLSVTNILIDVAPGDGDGLEVYAKSVQDVERAISKLSEKAEEWDMVQPRLKALEAEVEQWKIHAKEILSGEFDKAIHGLDLQATIELQRKVIADVKAWLEQLEGMLPADKALERIAELEKGDA